MHRSEQTISFLLHLFPFCFFYPTSFIRTIYVLLSLYLIKIQTYSQTCTPIKSLLSTNFRILSTSTFNKFFSLQILHTSLQKHFKLKLIYAIAILSLFLTSHISHIPHQQNVVFAHTSNLVE